MMMVVTVMAVGLHLTETLRGNTLWCQIDFAAGGFRTTKVWESPMSASARCVAD